MLKTVRARLLHGRPLVADIRRASAPPRFRGLPLLQPQACPAGCTECRDVCPSDALQTPLAIDMGRCIFCGDCQRACPAGAIQLSSRHRVGAGERAALVLDGRLEAADWEKAAIASRREIRRRFGRSLKLRSVSAGGCNGCEMELNACGNVNFDMGRTGIDIVASPRHADGLVLTGPVPENMAAALADTWEAIPEPRILVAAGACAISGGIFADAPALRRDFLAAHVPDLYVPGCPFHPLSFIDALLRFLGRA
jgi:Ni,Fe-hydrogenase III small subunit/NAD-dependent dihydropyrimidine dehydrogenase PreA subunit